MVAVALWAAVFAFVFPTVFRAVFHAELLAACRILADKRLVVGTLAATEPMAIGEPAGPCFKLFSTSLVSARSDYSFTAAKSAALCRAVLLLFSKA
jgi:hypothetical protein